MDVEKRVLIVSNRLPVKISSHEGELAYHTSEGGWLQAWAACIKKAIIYG